MKREMRWSLTWCVLASSGLAACGDEDLVPQTVDPGIFSPLGEPRRNASPEELEMFERGRQVALRRFTLEDGLGNPGFNLTFCAGCHEKPVFGGSAGRYRDFQLVAEVNELGYFPTGFSGVQQTYSNGVDGRVYVATDAETNHFATRSPIPIFGVGLIDELPSEVILANEDPDDADGDGISGRVNWVGDIVGRFGRKSQTESIEGFIRGPLFNHVGITSNPLTEAEREALPGIRSDDFGLLASGIAVSRRGQSALADAPVVDDDAAPDPELPAQDLFDLIAFSLLLGAPEPEPLEGDSAAGKVLFEQVGCEGCHIESLTGPRGPVPLYSDLLLHDMGDALGDGVRMAGALGNEFRTQPLWGIVAVGPYLHDGRADTLDEAIRWHGGEAEASKLAYEALSPRQRGQVIAFLESLGGRDQFTEGLLPPGAPVPEVGEPGGPVDVLSAAERDLFERGRRVFDRDTAYTDGLGPQFNGDSCRACHFEASIGSRESVGLSGDLDEVFVGGAGPKGLNVVRRGILEPDGSFRAPVGGTINHRFLSAGNARNEPDPEANLFELRQSPPVFGLGLIDRVDVEAMRALADPDDADADGISGRLHVLEDGRVGRMGWKADIPSIAEFVRDALSAELGLTLPPEPGLTFGVLTDDDDVPDPEATPEDMEALRFFLAQLAPPPPISTDAALEARGASMFDAVGCDGCHVAQMPTTDGGQVTIYSDLLLHEIAPEGFVGVPIGDAGMREFKTAPLWAVSRTAPYMHDGRSSTLDHAIRRHDGEARASRDAYDALPSEDRAALLAFLRSL